MRKNIKKTLMLLIISIMSYLCLCGYTDADIKVIDEAGIYTYEQMLALNELAIKYGKEVKLDIVICTTKTANGRNVEDVAHALYRDMGFGYDDCDTSGAIMYVDMYQRDFAIVVFGAAYAMVDDTDLNNMLDDVAEYMSDDDYYVAAHTYLEMVYEYAMDFINDNEEEMEAWYDATGPILPFMTIFRNPLSCIIAGLIVAAIVTLILYSTSKAKNTVYPRTYAKAGSVNFPVETERYLYSRTTTRQIQTSSGGRTGGSSGGGSSRGGSRSF